MVFDFWWLLLIPLAFALGWLAARYDLKQLLSESATLPRSYFRGLNFLLNEQSDQAIDAFIEVAKLDPETIELYFALGNLFRRRGETDRAIRVHQNLLSRVDLPEAEHAHVLFELGQDFLKSGMLDQAETTFLSLQKGSYVIEAKKALLTIFEIEKEWKKAIEIADELMSMTNISLIKEKAHFFCELAEESLQKKDIEQAYLYLKQATKSDSSNVRATILSGKLAFSEQEYERAIKIWQTVEAQNPIHLPLIIHPLMQAYLKLDQADQGLAVLMEYVKKFPSSELLDAAYRYITEVKGKEEAHIFIREHVEKWPDISGMMNLLDIMIKNSDESQKKELELMQSFIKRRIKSLPKYTCQSCGFRARLFYWQCPGCSEWETYTAKQSVLA